MNISLEIVRCPDLYDPPYGSVNQTDNKPGSTAQYECDYGFKLVGDARRKCLYNGYWSGKEPVCKRKQHAIRAYEIPVTDLLIKLHMQRSYALTSMTHHMAV